MLLPPHVMSAQRSCHPHDRIQARPVGQVAQSGRSLDQTLAFLAWLLSHVACLQTVPMSFSLRLQWGLNRQPLAGDLVGALTTSPTGHSRYLATDIWHFIFGN